MGEGHPRVDSNGQIVYASGERLGDARGER